MSIEQGKHAIRPLPEMTVTDLNSVSLLVFLCLFRVARDPPERRTCSSGAKALDEG
jgi:hypothetical protein